MCFDRNIINVLFAVFVKLTNRNSLLVKGLINIIYMLQKSLYTKKAAKAYAFIGQKLNFLQHMNLYVYFAISKINVMNIY